VPQANPKFNGVLLGDVEGWAIRPDRMMRWTFDGAACATARLNPDASKAEECSTRKFNCVCLDRVEGSATRPPVNRSGLNHGETRNQSKVADIQSCDAITKMQRRGANQKIFESNTDAAGCLLALYFSSELSDFECDGMDR
jgi:hypothetical protein